MILKRVELLLVVGLLQLVDCWKIEPFGEHSLRISIGSRSIYSPFLDAPLSNSSNSNIRANIVDGLLTVQRISDKQVLFKELKLEKGPAVGRGRFPSLQLTFQGYHRQVELLSRYLNN